MSIVVCDGNGFPFRRIHKDNSVFSGRSFRVAAGFLCMSVALSPAESLSPFIFDVKTKILLRAAFTPQLAVFHRCCSVQAADEHRH